MQAMARTVILVDERNNPVGTQEAVQAHTGAGQLHRAFSVYVFRNAHKEILIQRRSQAKMLWPLTWANTCCSHPMEGESAVEAGIRRLREEFGFAVALREGPDFVYRAEDPNGRGVEHEYVTILVGEVLDDTDPKPDPGEIADWKWVEVRKLLGDMQKNPLLYAPWFHRGLPMILQKS